MKNREIKFSNEIIRYDLNKTNYLKGVQFCPILSVIKRFRFRETALYDQDDGFRCQIPKIRA